MNILIDTNIVISLEPTSPEHMESRTATAADFVRVASEGGHRLLLHPASLRELAGDKDPARRTVRAVLLGKYPRLEPAPAMHQTVLDALGVVEARSHDHVDHLMLSAVVTNSVQFLVTDDGGIIRKASRLGIADRVLTVEDALALLTSLLGRTPEPPPLVEATRSYDLDLADTIFDSFRADYAGFDQWFVKCQLEQRPAWVIRDGRHLAAVCIIKEHDNELPLDGPTLKVCSLKVSEQRAGRRYGELLLKTLFRYLDENRYAYAFLTVHEHHEGLISLLEDFGFTRRLPDKASTHERYYVKALRPSDEQRAAMAPLDFHIMFGPPAVKLDDVFLVPILPQYHRLLFPDGEAQDQPTQLELDLVNIGPREPRPFGNAIRKAYLSHTPSRQLRPGSTLLFYRSTDQQAVTCVGIVEDTLVSGDATSVAEFVGQRTVYSLEEIAAMCRGRREVVSIRFRHDRLLDSPIGREEMVQERMAGGAPMSVQRVPEEVIPWLRARIGG
jgi:ribosomal protein S18 acetylase RimI-like enzyme